MFGKPGPSGSSRKRASLGVAVSVSLAVVAAVTATPTYGKAPAEVTSLEQSDVPAALAAAKKAGKNLKITGATTERGEFYATPWG